MKNYYCLLIIFYINSYSQNFQWVDFPVVTNGFSNNGLGCPITCDNVGNVYEVGFKNNFFNSTAIYGNLFYRKYNSAGTLIFDRPITGKVRAVNLTSDNIGNIYLVAIFKESITFDSGGTITTANSLDTQIIIKFDSAGNFMWNQNISNYGSFNHFNAIATDAYNDVYIGVDNFTNSQILKLSAANGSTLQTINQTNVQIISSLSIDELGNIYAAGSCGKPSSVFAGVAQPTILDYSIYIVKYTAAGVHQWTKYVQDISCLDPIVSAKSSDNIYLSSSLSGAFAFGNLTSQGPPSGFSDDIFITKLNSSGNFVWLREVPGTGKAYIGNRNFLTSDSSGNVYFAGSTKGTTIWSPNISTTISGFTTGALVLKYNLNGDLLLAKTTNSSNSNTCDGIAVDNSSNIFISGRVSGGVTFDTISSLVGSQVPFIAKIGGNLKNNEFYSDKKINIYPNPTENNVIIYNLENKTKGFIYNVVGQKIKNIEIENNATIVTSDLISGIYFIKLDGYAAEKIIKK